MRKFRIKSLGLRVRLQSVRPLVLIIFSFLVFSSFAYAQQSTQGQALDGAPGFSLLDLSQNKITLSDYRNKQGVILFFWTTRCPYCVGELKILNQKYEQLTKEGIEILAIDVGEPLRRVDDFVKKNKLGYKVLLDLQAEVAYLYGILGVPTYIGIDKKGYIRFQRHQFPIKDYQLLAQ